MRKGAFEVALGEGQDFSRWKQGGCSRWPEQPEYWEMLEVSLLSMAGWIWDAGLSS